MGNCLVTKLKESVNNDNLNELGKTSMIINNSNTDVSGLILFVEKNQGVVATIVGDGTFTDGTKTATEVDNGFAFNFIYLNVAASESDVEIVISNKYAVCGMEVPEGDYLKISFNTDEFAFNNTGFGYKGNYLTVGGSINRNIIGSIEKMLINKASELLYKEINLVWTKISGDISVVPSNSQLTSIGFNEFVHGSIDNFGLLANINTITLTEENKNVTGSIEQLTKNMFLTTKVSNSLAVYNPNLGSILFNGQIPNYSNITININGNIATLTNEEVIIATYNYSTDTWTYSS